MAYDVLSGEGLIHGYAMQCCVEWFALHGQREVGFLP